MYKMPANRLQNVV